MNYFQSDAVEPSIQAEACTLQSGSVDNGAHIIAGAPWYMQQSARKTRFRIV